MDRLLTQDEIEELLKAVASGEVQPARELAKGSHSAVNIDLFSSATVKTPPSLDLFYDGFIRHFRVTMTNRLRKLVDVKKGVARTFKFDDFVQTLPAVPHINIFKIEPLKGASLFALDSDLVYLIIDSILGGDGTNSSLEKNRAFSGIELKIIGRIVKDIIADMEKSWSSIINAKLSHIKTELNPRLVNIVPPEYSVITMNLTIETESARGSMVFAIPLTTVEPIREKLRTGSQFDTSAIDPHWSTRLVQGIHEAYVDLTAELGTQVITASELLSLQPGDTVILNSDIKSEMPVLVQGVDKFTATPGTQVGNKAIKIVRVLPIAESAA